MEIKYIPCSTGEELDLLGLMITFYLYHNNSHGEFKTA